MGGELGVDPWVLVDEADPGVDVDECGGAAPVVVGDRLGFDIGEGLQ
ncbi:hypothetical protein I7331_27110 [Frankia sp. AgB1.8]|nr:MULTISPECIES: hypothetical protein [unclassified Frankia]MBL7622853.1 hypothetical protein [Frankia sp. AgB1.8]